MAEWESNDPLEEELEDPVGDGVESGASEYEAGPGDDSTALSLVEDPTDEVEVGRNRAGEALALLNMKQAQEEIAFDVDELDMRLEPGSVARRIFDRYAVLGTEGVNEGCLVLRRADIEPLFNSMLQMPVYQSIYTQVVDAISIAVQKNARDKAKDPWKGITSNLKVERFWSGGSIFIGDANGATDLLTDPRVPEPVRVKFAQTVHRLVQDIANAYENVEAIIWPPGDLFAFAIPEGPDHDRIAMEIEAYVQGLRIPMEASALAEMKRDDGSDVYPIDPDTGKRYITWSVGLSENGERGAVLSIMTGKVKDAKAPGRLFSYGKGFVAAQKNQKEAQPGETLMTPALQARFAQSGMEFGERGEVTTRTLAQDTMEAAEDLRDYAMPNNLIHGLKVMEVMAMASPHVKGSMEACISGEAMRTADLGVTAMTINAGDLNDLAERPEDFNAFHEQLLAWEGQYPWLRVSKTVDGMVYLHMDLAAGKDNAAGVATYEQEHAGFLRRLRRLVRKHKLTLKIGEAYEDAVTIVPIPGTPFIDFTGPGVVASTRGATMKVGENYYLAVHASQAFRVESPNVEMLTIYVKGKAYPMVLYIIDGNGKLKAKPAPLVGRENIEKNVESFLDQIGEGVVSYTLDKPADATADGYGTSALFRHAEYQAEQKGIRVFKLVPEGEDDIPYLRSLVTQVADLPDGLSREEILDEFDLLLETGAFWSEKTLITLDAPSISPEEAKHFDRLLVTAVGMGAAAPVAMLHTRAYEFRVRQLLGEGYDYALQSDVVDAFTVKETFAAIASARPDLPADDPHFREVLMTFLEDRARQGETFIARPVLHNLAKALRVNGGRVELDENLYRELWAGELARSLDQEGMSDRQRYLLGCVARYGFPISASLLVKMDAEINGNVDHISLYEEMTSEDHRWSEVTQGELTVTRNVDTEGRQFQEKRTLALKQLREMTQLLDALCPRFLTKVTVEGKAHYILANSNQRAVASSLSRVDNGPITNYLLTEGLSPVGELVDVKNVSPENIAWLEMELEHRLSHPEHCVDARTIQLVHLLSVHYHSYEHNVGAARNIHDRLLKAIDVQGLELSLTSANVDYYLDLAWVLTQSQDKKDREVAVQIYTKVREQGMETPENILEVIYRLDYRLPVLERSFCPDSMHEDFKDTYDLGCRFFSEAAVKRFARQHAAISAGLEHMNACDSGPAHALVRQTLALAALYQRVVVTKFVYGEAKADTDKNEARAALEALYKELEGIESAWVPIARPDAMDDLSLEAYADGYRLRGALHKELRHAVPFPPDALEEGLKHFKEATALFDRMPEGARPALKQTQDAYEAMLVCLAFRIQEHTSMLHAERLLHEDMGLGGVLRSTLDTIAGLEGEEEVMPQRAADAVNVRVDEFEGPSAKIYQTRHALEARVQEFANELPDLFLRLRRTANIPLWLKSLAHRRNVIDLQIQVIASVPLRERRADLKLLVDEYLKHAEDEWRHNYNFALPASGKEKAEKVVEKQKGDVVNELFKALSKLPPRLRPELPAPYVSYLDATVYGDYLAGQVA